MSGQELAFRHVDFDLHFIEPVNMLGASRTDPAATEMQGVDGKSWNQLIAHKIRRVTRSEHSLLGAWKVAVAEDT